MPGGRLGLTVLFGAKMEGFGFGRLGRMPGGFAPFGLGAPFGWPPGGGALMVTTEKGSKMSLAQQHPHLIYLSQGRVRETRTLRSR